MEGTAARCDPAKGPGGGAQSGAASGLVSWRGGGGDEAGKAGEAFIIFSKTMTISFFFFFGLFRAAPTADGGSQARGQIEAAAAGLHHSHAGSKPHL